MHSPVGLKADGAVGCAFNRSSSLFEAAGRIGQSAGQHKLAHSKLL